MNCLYFTKVQSRRGALVVILVDQVLLWMAWALVSVEMDLRNTSMNTEGIILSILTTISCSSSGLAAVGAALRPKRANMLLIASAALRLLHIALNVYYFKLAVKGVFRLAFLPTYVPFALVATGWAILWILWDVYWLYQVIGFEQFDEERGYQSPPHYAPTQSTFLRQASQANSTQMKDPRSEPLIL